MLRHKKEIKTVIEIGTRRIEKWTRSKSLQLAPEKTEVVTLTNKRKLEKIAIICTAKIESKPAIKYLSVWLNNDTNIKEHIEKTAETTNATNNLTCQTYWLVLSTPCHSMERQ